MPVRPHSKEYLSQALAVVALAGILLGTPGFGSEDPSSATLQIHRSDGTMASYHAYPENVVRLLFPKGEATIGPDEIPEASQGVSAIILKKAKIVEVSDTDQRFNVTGVISGDQLFIFDGVFSDNDAATMSQLMRATASGPGGKKEALDFARLYLALSRYKMGDFYRIVAYKGDGPAQIDSRRGQDAHFVSEVAHPPEVVSERGAYVVDFYAYDEPQNPAKGVSHWKIDVSANGLEERLSAHHDQFRPFYVRAGSEWTQPAGKVIFAPTLMGNGWSSDGATTDLQSWGSSDGPGVSRTHYYYKSHEPADKRMQDYLHKAVAVIETGPWRDSQGKSMGTEVILIRANDSEESLFASFVGEDANSVLEVSCSSLGNLLRAIERDLPEWRH
jgi:hypothetical protein